jgi:hypothetical protein
MLSAFPVAMGILAVTITELRRVAGIQVFAAATFGSSSMLWISIIVLVCLLVFAAVICINDFTSRPIGPYVLRGAIAQEAFKLEKELRDAVRAKAPTGGRRARGPRHRPSSSTNLHKVHHYQQLVQLRAPADIIRNGNLVAAAYLVVGLMGTLACIFYFWYVAVLVLSHQTLSDVSIRRLMTIFILLITWFPMRIHMDWYQNSFHNRQWLRQSNGFKLGIVLAVASLIFVITIAKPEAIAIVCAVTNALILLFVGLAGKFRPEWLHLVAEELQSMPFLYFFAAYVIFLVVTATIAIRILNA